MRKLIFTGLIFTGLLFSLNGTRANNANALPPQFRNCEEALEYLQYLQNTENNTPYLLQYTLDYLEANDCSYPTIPRDNKN